MRRVESCCRLDELPERAAIEPVAFTKIDGSPGTSAQTGIEQSGGVVKRRAEGPGARRQGSSQARTGAGNRL